jgi:flavoprotein
VVPVSNGGCRICLAVSPKVALVMQCDVLLLKFVSSVSVVPNHEMVVGGVSVQLFVLEVALS